MDEAPEPPRRNTPNLNRPRLSDEDEAKLLPLDELTARAYTALEDGIAAIRALFDDGVPIAVNVTDTGVIKLDAAAQAKIKSG